MITIPYSQLQSTVEAINVIMYGDLQDLVNDAKALLKNKDIPLDDRWEAYKTLVRNGALSEVELCHDGFTDHLDRIDGTETSIYDHLYVERHETTTYIDLHSRILDKEAWTSESIDVWRELVLESADAGFEFDW